MNTSETLGVVYWNTWYRAEPSAQLKHIEKLEASMAQNGADKTLFCLSEATRNHMNGLVDSLEHAGYVTAYMATSNLKNGIQEGLCFAVRQDITAPIYTELSIGRAIANVKTRWLGHISFAGLSIFSTHTSYPRPTRQETSKITDQLEVDRRLTGYMEAQILGGDFNTVINKREVVKAAEEFGMTKLAAATRIKNTVPFGKIGFLGIELDHVFVSDRIYSKTSMDIGPKGPSNHRPLLVTTEL